MQSFEVYKYVNALSRTRGDDLSYGPEPTGNLNRTFKGDKIHIHVFADHSECHQILRDTNFIQPKFADAIAEIFCSIGSEAKVIENFLAKNPIGLDGQPHIAARQSFASNYRSAQRSLSDRLPIMSRRAFESFIHKKNSSITADLIEPYVDTVIEAILHDKIEFAQITRDSWSGYSSCIFEYVHSPAKLKKKDAQVSRIAGRFGPEFAGGGEEEINSEPILLSYILQGRDPLIGGLSAYMHSLVSMNEDKRSFSIGNINARGLFWRTSPVNYIGRIATKPATVGSIHIQAGDHVVLMLPWANHDTAAKPENSLAFGAGAHVCAGQALSLAIGGAWIDGLKSHHTRIHWREIRPDRSTPAVFRQYGRE
jgi:hypothetical protein